MRRPSGSAEALARYNALARYEVLAGNDALAGYDALAWYEALVRREVHKSHRGGGTAVEKRAVNPPPLHLHSECPSGSAECQRRNDGGQCGGFGGLRGATVAQLIVRVAQQVGGKGSAAGPSPPPHTRTPAPPQPLNLLVV
eukprot:362872-Chlamydomonas_euryale.AAC.1